LVIFSKPKGARKHKLLGKTVLDSVCTWHRWFHFCECYTHFLRQLGLNMQEKRILLLSRWQHNNACIKRKYRPWISCLCQRYAHAPALKFLSQYTHCDFITDCVGWGHFLSVLLSMEILNLALNISNRRQNIPIICHLESSIFVWGHFLGN